MSFSFLDVDFNDGHDRRVASRKATVVAKQRVDDHFGVWFREASTQDALAERVNFAYDDLQTIVAQACEEHHHDNPSAVTKAIIASYAIVSNGACANCGGPLGPDGTCAACAAAPPSAQAPHHLAPTARTASVHEARKPKMCPFHKDVVDISLSAEDARAGYDAMAQHWGGPRHCEGDGYEGTKCNFKPQMTTQAYWDQKAEKAEERKQQREQEAIQQAPTEPTDETPVEHTEPETIDQGSEGAEVIEMPSTEPSAVGEGASEEPMLMAAGTKTANEYIKKQGDQWVILQKGTGKVLSHHDSEEDAEASFRAMMANKHGKTADSVTGLGSPEPKIDKRKWTPQTVPADEPLKADDPNGPHPTKRKDILEPIRPENPDKLEEIGEQVTEHVDLPSSDNAGFSEGGPTKGDATKTFPNGNQANPVTTKLKDDVNRNPIEALIEGKYDGFVPAETVQSAISSYRKS